MKTRLTNRKESNKTNTKRNKIQRGNSDVFKWFSPVIVDPRTPCLPIWRNYHEDWKIFFKLILDKMLWNDDEGNGFVKISANWCFDSMGRIVIMPSRCLSCTAWQSISICLVHSWNMRFEAICIAAWLSQNRLVGLIRWISRSSSNWCIQQVSIVVSAIALYSTSADDREIVGCFFDFHDMSASPRII